MVIIYKALAVIKGKPEFRHLALGLRRFRQRSRLEDFTRALHVDEIDHRKSYITIRRPSK
jgi:hypothetical protein